VPRCGRAVISAAKRRKNAPFQEEFVAFLKRHGIEYDERYIWD